MEFEWDFVKARSNFQRHRVNFGEAETVFEDRLRISFLDEEHSIDEDRYITVGMSDQDRILLVAHTYRQGRIRIISARGVTQNERRVYTEGL